jgi:hypothetical protein
MHVVYNNSPYLFTACTIGVIAKAQRVAFTFTVETWAKEITVGTKTLSTAITTNKQNTQPP